MCTEPFVSFTSIFRKTEMFYICCYKPVVECLLDSGWQWGAGRLESAEELQCPLEKLSIKSFMNYFQPNPRRIDTACFVLVTLGLSVIKLHQVLRETEVWRGWSKSLSSYMKTLCACANFLIEFKPKLHLCVSEKIDTFQEPMSQSGKCCLPGLCLIELHFSNLYLQFLSSVLILYWLSQPQLSYVSTFMWGAAS